MDDEFAKLTAAQQTLHAATEAGVKMFLQSANKAVPIDRAGYVFVTAWDGAMVVSSDLGVEQSIVVLEATIQQLRAQLLRMSGGLQ